MDKLRFFGIFVVMACMVVQAKELAFSGVRNATSELVSLGAKQVPARHELTLSTSLVIPAIDFDRYFTQYIMDETFAPEEALTVQVGKYRYKVWHDAQGLKYALVKSDHVAHDDARVNIIKIKDRVTKLYLVLSQRGDVINFAVQEK